MMGLILWYKPDPGVGMVWCDDQGPLAFVGPEVQFPDGVDTLHCGDQLLFSFELREGVRYVRDVMSLTAGTGAHDPREIIANYQQTREAERSLRVVA